MNSKKIFWIAITLAWISLLGYRVYQYATYQGQDCRNFTAENVQVDSLQFIQKGGIINDVSCLNKTPIYGIVRIKTVEDIQNAVNYARVHNLKISIAGARHSMGGQAFAPDALVLDMLDFNAVTLDEKNKIITVQAGALWHDLQYFLHDYNLAVKAMQSSSIFSIGGSISVNAHGMDFRVGSVASTIKSIRIVNAQGNIKKISRESDPLLFKCVIGGYGLFGIIVDAEIQVTDNVMYQANRTVIPMEELPEYFNDVILADPSYELFYAHLSTEHLTFLKQAIVYAFKKISDYQGVIPPLKEVGHVNIRRFIFNLSKPSYFGKKFKWFAEKYLDTEEGLKACIPFAKKDDKAACFISRNEAMHDAVEYLRNALRNEVDILQEYYIPVKNLVPFIKDLSKMLSVCGMATLNVSLRIVHQEDIILNYAPHQTMFAVVLYLNQQTTDKGIARMQKLTRKIIDLALAHEGTFFLPYQLYYSPEQLKKAYPMIDEFFTLKKKFDPNEIFTNTFYESYKE